MGVYRRFRAPTDFDTLELCDDLKRETAKYIMNEKRVPKRWRFIYGTKLLEYADKIREYVTFANYTILIPSFTSVCLKTTRDSIELCLSRIAFTYSFRSPGRLSMA